MRSEDGFAVWDAGEPGETGADTVGPAVSTEPVPCVKLLEQGVGWVTVVAAAGAFAEPVPTSVGTAKTEAKASSAASKARPRPGQRSTVATEPETRATKLSEGAERSSMLIRGPCMQKSQKSAEVKGSPPKTALSVWSTSPPKPTPGIGEEGALSPQALLGRYHHPQKGCDSSTHCGHVSWQALVSGGGSRRCRSRILCGTRVCSRTW